MAFYCWGWRVTSIGCPDCEEEYPRVSFDWAQLSLLGDGGSTACPRGRPVQRFSQVLEPIWKETLM